MLATLTSSVESLWRHSSRLSPWHVICTYACSLYNDATLYNPLLYLWTTDQHVEVHSPSSWRFDISKILSMAPKQPSQLLSILAVTSEINPKCPSPFAARQSEFSNVHQNISGGLRTSMIPLPTHQPTRDRLPHGRFPRADWVSHLTCPLEQRVSSSTTNVQSLLSIDHTVW